MKHINGHYYNLVHYQFAGLETADDKINIKLVDDHAHENSEDEIQAHNEHMAEEDAYLDDGHIVYNPLGNDAIHGNGLAYMVDNHDAGFNPMIGPPSQGRILNQQYAGYDVEMAHPELAFKHMSQKSSGSFKSKDSRSSEKKVCVTIGSGKQISTNSDRSIRKCSSIQEFAKEVDRLNKKAHENIKVPWKRLFLDLKGARCHLFLGLFFAMTAGTTMPLTGFFLSGMADALSKYTDPAYTKDEAWSQTITYSIAFFCLAINAFLSNALMMSQLTLAGEFLTTNLRTQVFGKFMYHDTAYFDVPENSPGACSERLSADAKRLNSLMSTVLGSIVLNISAFMTGLLIAFICSWRMTLVTLAAVPFIVINNGLNMLRVQKMAEGATNLAGASIVQENVTNIRTVRAMNTTEHTINRFMTEVLGIKISICGEICGGILFGISQGTAFFIMSYIFYLGAVFRRDYGIEYMNVLRALFGIIFAALGAGMAATMAGDMAESKVSCYRIYQI